MTSFSSLIPLLLLLILSQNGEFLRVAEGKIHITDDLDDVVDDEEDESWKQWGKKKTTPSSDDDLKPTDLSKMEMSEIQAEIMKRQSGPAFGFVKLRLGLKRTRVLSFFFWGVCIGSSYWDGEFEILIWFVNFDPQDMVAETAMKWTKVLKTGGVEAKFMGVDLSTIMFTMERGQDVSEVLSI